MIALVLRNIHDIFVQCMKDSAVFKRPQATGNFFETNDLAKDQKRWLVLAAGVNENEAGEVFPRFRKRAERSLIPLRFGQSCDISILFVVRAFDGDFSAASPLSLIVPFCSQRGIPWIEIREGYVRIWNLPDNKHSLSNLRWEWDVHLARDDPYEKWLRQWKRDIGFNPAHPPSHLHINTERLPIGEEQQLRPGDRIGDLRLAVGNPNPLAFLFSLAVWLRTCSFC